MQNIKQLTLEQIANKKFIKNYIFKLQARNSIEVNVGDVYDQLADISKRVGMLERITMRMFHKELNNVDASLVKDWVNEAKAEALKNNRSIVEERDLIKNLNNY